MHKFSREWGGVTGLWGVQKCVNYSVTQLPQVTTLLVQTLLVHCPTFQMSNCQICAALDFPTKFVQKAMTECATSLLPYWKQ